MVFLDSHKYGATKDPVLFYPRIRVSEWKKNPDPESGMNIPDHISESLEKNVWDKNTFFDVDPGYGRAKFGSGIRNKHPGSATLLAKTKNIYLELWGR